MRELKFRQFVADIKAWHYWGFLEAGDDEIYFASPMPDLPSYQYTGLKDENGVDIYEGDILSFKLNTRYGYIDKRGVVRCEDLASGCVVNFLPNEIDGCPLDFMVIEPEIIGTIFQYKELLKKGGKL